MKASLSLNIVSSDISGDPEIINLISDFKVKAPKPRYKCYERRKKAIILSIKAFMLPASFLLVNRYRNTGFPMKPDVGFFIAC